MSPVHRPSSSSFAALAGHFWTVSGFLSRSFSGPPLPRSKTLTIDVASDLGSGVHLTAELHEVSGHNGSKADPHRASDPTGKGSQRPLVVLVHGLGGSADSGYVKHVAGLATGRGLATLRLNLRGANRTGWDFYHAGLTRDIASVLEHPDLKQFDGFLVLGFSLGGHVTLKLACDEGLPGRVNAVAALCPPLDLVASSAALDAPNLWLYRGHVLRGLKEMYLRFLSHVQVSGDAVLRSRLKGLNMPDAKTARNIGRIGDWDEHIVARRHGFPSAHAYYLDQRVSTRLHRLQTPSLIVTARFDPMVPHATTRSALGDLAPARDGRAWAESRISPLLSHWELPSGGHVAWPTPAAPARSVIHHMLDWLVEPR